PMHIAGGLTWLQGNASAAQIDNPPLARILSAVPAWIRRLPILPAGDLVTRGDSVLYNSDYRRNISEARLGNLLMLMIGIASVAVGGARRFGAGVGLCGAALFSELPMIRGHAGLATTDMAVAATYA